jgi:hypothetical protein
MIEIIAPEQIELHSFAKLQPKLTTRDEKYDAQKCLSTRIILEIGNEDLFA